MKRFLWELIQASLVAALFGLPFFIYLWRMTP
jgi:ABC-type Fe3+-siderophore transport system permease subunit